jgi:flagellar operon protein
MKINDVRINNIPSNRVENDKKTNDRSFEKVLGEKSKSREEITFSKHASQRLESRNIILDQNDLARLRDAIDLAEGKGIKNSLIIMDDIVLIANIHSRTIVTAIDKQSMKDKVFTNVDGAVNI